MKKQILANAQLINPWKNEDNRKLKILESVSLIIIPENEGENKNETDLHSYHGLLRLTRSQQNQSKKWKKHKKPHDKRQNIASTRYPFSSLLIFKKTLLFNHIKLLPVLLSFPLTPTTRSHVIRRNLPGSGLKRARESAGGWFPRVAAHRRVRVRRRSRRTSHYRSRVKRGNRLLPIVRITRWALHVVYRTPVVVRRGWGGTGDFGIGLCVHLLVVANPGDFCSGFELKRLKNLESERSGETRRLSAFGAGIQNAMENLINNIIIIHSFSFTWSCFLFYKNF